MAGGKGNKDKVEKDSDQSVSMAQVQELLEQQKVFYKELLQQQESNFKAFVCTILDTSSKRIGELLKDLQDLRTSLQFTQKEVDELKTTCKGTQSICKSQESDIERLAESMLILDAKSDSLDSQARRANLIMDGIPEAEKENNLVSEEKVLKIIEEKLNLDPKIIGVEQAMRAGKVNISSDGTQGRPRPVIVRFHRIKDRDTVLRNARKLKGTSIFINEDYPETVRQKRKELLPKMKEARERGDYAFLRYDKLIIRQGEKKNSFTVQ